MHYCKCYRRTSCCNNHLRGCGWHLQIEVPGNWEMQGHGIPIYTNFNYPWPITAPFVPEENPTGCYRRSFDLPEGWQHNRYTPHLRQSDSYLCSLCHS